MVCAVAPVVSTRGDPYSAKCRRSRDGCNEPIARRARVRHVPFVTTTGSAGSRRTVPCAVIDAVGAARRLRPSCRKCRKLLHRVCAIEHTRRWHAMIALFTTAQRAPSGSTTPSSAWRRETTDNSSTRRQRQPGRRNGDHAISGNCPGRGLSLTLDERRSRACTTRRQASPAGARHRRQAPATADYVRTQDVKAIGGDVGNSSGGIRVLRLPLRPPQDSSPHAWCGHGREPGAPDSREYR